MTHDEFMKIAKDFIDSDNPELGERTYWLTVSTPKGDSYADTRNISSVRGPSGAASIVIAVLHGIDELAQMKDPTSQLAIDMAQLWAYAQRLMTSEGDNAQ